LLMWPAVGRSGHVAAFFGSAALRVCAFGRLWRQRSCSTAFGDDQAIAKSF
jgi:hypothetical protein